MTRRPRVGVLKPDYGSNGGFERLLDRVQGDLEARGLVVETVSFDARTRADQLYSLDVAGGIRDWHDEYFLLVAAIERMDRLRLDDFDVLLTTQPPTYLAEHDRIVSLVYHQARVFYDLADAFVESGFVDAAVHAAATQEIRATDLARLDGPRRWVAGSAEVASRLATYWGVNEGVRLFSAAPNRPKGASGTELLARYDPGGPAVCVSRHEWPKRTELVVQAAHLDPETQYEMVGGGSRLAWARALDRRYRTSPERALSDGPAETWRNTGPRLLDCEGDADEDHFGRTIGGTVFHGEASDRERDAAYDRAAVVVAPSHREDYGLTVLEAFARARPVVVCDDGGGLVELVEDTGAAVVVEPTAEAIARAVETLRADPTLARSMAEAALDAAARHVPGPDIEVLVSEIETAGDQA